MSHPFFNLFEKLPAIMPVIHLQSCQQARNSVQIAADHNVDGIWLIDHQARNPHYLISVYAELREEFPELWMGTNFLGLHPEDAFELLPETLQGYWSDDFGLAQALENHVFTEVSSRVCQAQRESGWRGLHFGGMAFKYQRPVPDEALFGLAKIAGEIVGDLGVITTSGEKTGAAPAIEKVAAIKRGLSEVGPKLPLAIASGTDETNIAMLAEHVDCFLVASSITEHQTELLIPSKLKKLMKAAGR